MAKHGIAIVKLGAFPILFALGGFVGKAASEVFVPAAAVAQAGLCEDSECHHGWYGDSCQATPDNDTTCVTKRRWWWFDTCMTTACEN